MWWDRPAGRSASDILEFFFGSENHNFFRSKLDVHYSFSYKETRWGDFLWRMIFWFKLFVFLFSFYFPYRSIIYNIYISFFVNLLSSSGNLPTYFGRSLFSDDKALYILCFFCNQWQKISSGTPWTTQDFQTAQSV